MAHLLVFALSLGRALFVFAALEWNSAHCCEKIAPGYLNNLETKTAGLIADNLIWHVETQRPQIWVSHEAICREFKALKLCNTIMHGKPGSTSGGNQRLFNKGVPFDVTAIDDAADQFAVCSIQVREMHDLL